MAEIKEIFVINHHGFETTELRLDFDNNRHYAASFRDTASPKQVLAALINFTKSLEYDIDNGVFD